jgi:hypothetical protein
MRSRVALHYDNSHFHLRRMDCPPPTPLLIAVSCWPIVVWTRYRSWASLAKIIGCMRNILVDIQESISVILQISYSLPKNGTSHFVLHLQGRTILRRKYSPTSLVVIMVASMTIDYLLERTSWAPSFTLCAALTTLSLLRAKCEPRRSYDDVSILLQSKPS